MSDLFRTQALNNIPQKKLDLILEGIRNSDEDDNKKNLRITAALRYAETNIPITYWALKMEKDFHGDPNLLKEYNDYTSDLKASFINGRSICLAGSNGVGKSFTSCSILKKAALKSFSCLYTTLTDVVNVLTQADNESKFLAKRELMIVDFLVLDEVDPRFIASDNASDLYGRSLEGVFRTRGQNKLPTIICTNSPNVVESFNGTLKQSLGSLMSEHTKIIPVFGTDYRKKLIQ